MNLYHLIIFGAQGSGKGTQAALLKEKLGLLGISLGDLFREYAVEETPFGRQTKGWIDQGLLVPDEITNQAVAQKIGDIPPSIGFIIDGYPRNLEQATALQGTLEAQKRLLPRPVFLNLMAPEDELLRRLQKRSTVEGRPDDADETVIRRRLETYQNDTKPILENVGEWATVFDIDADKPIEDVHQEILGKLG